ncbi:MAG: ABC transporter ATP-binding protein [Eubacteriales bacterium]|nr:ABC transporter ATP-binding protein [Eubacteriales bacterium]
MNSTSKGSIKLKNIGRFFKSAFYFYVLAMVFACAASLMEMLRPIIIADIIDKIAVSMPADIAAAAAKVALVVFIAQVFKYFYQLNTVKGGETFVKDIRDGIFEHVLNLPAAWADTHKSGDIIQRCTMDVDEIKAFLSEHFVNLLNMLITLVLAIIFIARIKPLLALISICVVPVLVGFSYWFHNSVAAAFMSVEEEESRLSCIAQENFTGVRVVRAFGRERSERDKFLKQNDFVAEKWMVLCKYLCSYWAFSDVLTGTWYMIFLVIGGLITARGGLSIGNMVAALSYLVIMAQPVRSMGRVLSEMSKSEVSLDRILEVLNAPVEKDEPGAVSILIDGDIEFKNVSFAYPAGSNNVPGEATAGGGGASTEDEGFTEDDGLILKDVSFTIHRGETIGILGATGSGKSTLVKLLMGLYEPTEGSICINGTDVRNIKHGALRRQIGYVEQESFLFSRTIRENICIAADAAPAAADQLADSPADAAPAAAVIGVPDGAIGGAAGGVADDILERAIDTACLKGTISVLPEGLDTVVGERGVTLSGGQKQRVAIARSLVDKAPLLILDDSLSAVDAETDRAIRNNLKGELNKRTVILISHRIDTLKDADHIIVLEGGRISEEGTHEELIKGKGIYRTVYDIQSYNFDEEGPGPDRENQTNPDRENQAGGRARQSSTGEVEA